MRSLFFATPTEPREWLRGKDLSVRRLCDGKRSYKKSIRMPILLRSATYVAHPHSLNLSARSNESKKKGTPFLRSLFFATPDEPRKWLRGKDLNQRPSGYEPDELPDCSTPRYVSTTLTVLIYDTPSQNICQAFWWHIEYFL